MLQTTSEFSESNKKSPDPATKVADQKGGEEAIPDNATVNTEDVADAMADIAD